jgi:hypothetical protein
MDVWKGASSGGVGVEKQRNKALARIYSSSNSSMPSLGAASGAAGAEWRSGLAKFGQSALYTSAKGQLQSLEIERLVDRRAKEAAIEQERRQIDQDSIRLREEEMQRWEQEEQEALEAKDTMVVMRRGGVLSEDPGSAAPGQYSQKMRTERGHSLEIDLSAGHDKIQQMSSYLDMKFKERPLDSPVAKG